MIMYAGAMMEDPSIENIFAEDSKPAAHSIAEAKQVKSSVNRGFAASKL
jgi:ABC-type oligopeptide transport system ATPase subunit